MLQNPAYEQLRTVEQLGYYVQLGMYHEMGVVGICVAVQSEIPPHQLDDRIELFLQRRAGSDSAGSGCLGSDRVGSDRVGSDRVGSDRVGSDRVGSDRVGSDRVGCDTEAGAKLGRESSCASYCRIAPS